MFNINFHSKYEVSPSPTENELSKENSSFPFEELPLEHPPSREGRVVVLGSLQWLRHFVRHGYFYHKLNALLHNFKIQFIYDRCDSCTNLRFLFFVQTPTLTLPINNFPFTKTLVRITNLYFPYPN